MDRENSIQKGGSPIKNHDSKINAFDIDLEENIIPDYLKSTEKEEEKEIEYCESVIQIFYLYCEDSFTILILGSLYVLGMIWTFVFLDNYILEEFEESLEDDENGSSSLAFQLYAIPLYIFSLLFGSCIVTQITVNLFKAIVWTTYHYPSQKKLLFIVQVIVFWCCIFIPLLVGSTMATTLLLKILKGEIIEGFALLIDISVLMTIEEELPKYLQIKVPVKQRSTTHELYRIKSEEERKYLRALIEKDDLKNPANFQLKRSVVLGLYCINFVNMLWVGQYILAGLLTMHYHVAPLYWTSIAYLCFICMLSSITWLLYNIRYNPKELVRPFVVALASVNAVVEIAVFILYTPNSKSFHI